MNFIDLVTLAQLKTFIKDANGNVEDIVKIAFLGTAANKYLGGTLYQTVKSAALDYKNFNTVDWMTIAQTKKKIEEANGDVDQIAKILLAAAVVNKTMNGNLTNGNKQEYSDGRTMSIEELTEVAIRLKASPEFKTFSFIRRWAINYQVWMYG